MFERWSEHIERNLKLNKSAKFLLAISGGIDSVVLLDLLHRSNLSVSLAHCNFSLRGEESDGDHAFVLELAAKYYKPVFIETFNTTAHANKESVSTQIAARNLRYEWFEKLLAEHNLDFLLTAHHANDNIETVIFNLIKGTGISGLRGIKAFRRTIIRPLLPFTKEEINEYAKNHKLQWREDSSNSSNKYHRNRIRNEIIPSMKQINPRLENTMNTTIQKMASMERLLHTHVASFAERYFKENNGIAQIDIKALTKEPENVLILATLLEAYGFSYNNAKTIVAALNGQSGKRFYSTNHCLLVDREALIIEVLQKTQKRTTLIDENDSLVQSDGISLQINRSPGKDYDIKRGLDFAGIDESLISYPLMLRSWEEGDWFVPLGMRGKKKLSDFFIDQKIPLNLKRKVKVLCSGDSIVWVVGMRLDDKFKITEQTKSILELKVIDND